MALKCTLLPKIQFSATEIRWGESGHVGDSDILLAEAVASHWEEFDIG